MKLNSGNLNRRDTLLWLSASAAGLLAKSSSAQDGPIPTRTGMGLVIYDCNLRRRWMRKREADFDLFEPLTFLKHCHSLGAGGMQASLGVMDSGEVRRLRDFAEQHDLFIDAIIKPPKDRDDVSRFEAEVMTAKAVKVQAARTTIIPGRRYERFKTLAEFREFEARGQKMLERAAPVVEKHRIR